MHSNVSSFNKFQCIFKPCVDELSPASTMILDADCGFGKFPSFGRSPSGYVVGASAGPSTAAPPSVPKRGLFSSLIGLHSAEEAIGPSI